MARSIALGPPTTDIPRVALMIAVLAVLTAAVYGPVHRFEVVDYDDPQYLYDNPHIRQGITLAGIKDAFVNFHYVNYDPPLATLSFELDQNLFGLRPGIMHVENVLLHLIAGLLLWRLLFTATGELNYAFAVAALFLCHPMHVESVAWIAERKDVLSTPLLFMAMLAYVRYSRTHNRVTRWFIYALMLGLFTLSLFAKAMGVTLPALLLLLDYWPLARWPARSWRWLVIEKIPLILIAIGLSILQSIAQGSIGAYGSLEALGPGERISNAIVCYVIYLVKLAVPTDLTVFYPHPGDRPIAAVIAAGGMMALITVICWRLRKRNPFAIVGWLWFVGALVPVIGLVQIGAQAMADRYSYLPSVGLFIVVIWGVASIVRPGLVRLSLFLPVLLIFSMMAHRQVGYWQNTRTLFTHAIAVNDDNAVAHVELGNLAFREGNIRAAIDEYTRAGNDPHACSGLGNCWLATNRPLAIEYYRKALALRPKSAPYMMQLAGALQINGNKEEAERLAKAAMQIDPGNPALRAQWAGIQNAH